MALFINDPFLVWKLWDSFQTSIACSCHSFCSFLCSTKSHTGCPHFDFFRVSICPGESERYMFKININKIDSLISWLTLIATQTTWICPIWVYWSSQTCGFFCQMIENPCSICNLQIIDCSSLLMDQREKWVHDHNFCGCFPVRCLRWLVLVIFLHYKTCKL